MRPRVTQRQDGTELDIDAFFRRTINQQPGTYGTQTLPRRLAWSNFDSYVAACSESTKRQAVPLPWEAGIGRKMP